MKLLYSINVQEEKIKQALEKYRHLLNLNNNQSSKILFLVPNSITKLMYERNINLKYSEELNIITYISFVKKEIIKYWPIIVEKCKTIRGNNIVPIFISSNLSDYIINNEVSKKRNLEGYFDDLTSTNRGISNSIKNNINKSALSLIEFDTIGERLYLSKKNKDKLLRFSYTQMDEIINNYIETLLSKGMLDNPLSIYIYNNFLLNNEDYLKALKKRINYIIVDSLESCSNAEVDFIDTVSNFLNESHVYYNSTRDYSSFNNVDINYIEKNIIKKFNIVGNNENKMINNNLNINDLYSQDVEIELNQSSQLYSEMITEVTNKVLDLINNNFNPRDIAIISPVNNTILDYNLANMLKNYNIEAVNTKIDNKIIDYPFANALIVATCLFYEYEELIKEEEYISFIETIFNVNRIKALSIYRNRDENEEYKDLINYINRYKSDSIKIYEFLMRFYIDKLLVLKDGRSNIKICKQIIQESEIFTENISILSLDNKKIKEKIFIDVLKTTIKDYYLPKEIQDMKESNKVIITTPYSYISSNISRPIQLWVDIGSNSWNMKIEKDISNAIVLRKSYDKNKIYSDDMEEYYKKYYLYNMIYNLLESADKVYAFKSDYTVNGYMQESILYSLILKLLDKGGK